MQGSNNLGFREDVMIRVQKPSNAFSIFFQNFLCFQTIYLIHFEDLFHKIFRFQSSKDNLSLRLEFR